MMIKRELGFTLIEILVALVILAIIGSMMVVGLQSAIRSQSIINHQSTALSDLQSAITIMERDIAQIINRPIISEGNTLPAIRVKYQGDKLTLEFTHAGFINPFAGMVRTTLQRVSYTWDGSALLRSTWEQLDRTPGAMPATQTLLTHVQGFSVRFLDANHEFSPPGESNNQTQTAIHLLQQTGQQFSPLPIAIELNIKVDGFGTVTRVIPLAGKL